MIPRADAARQRALQSQLPQVAATMARSAHSGATLVRSLDETARSVAEPVRSDLGRVVRAVQHGVSVDEALDAWARRSGSPEVQLLVGAAQLGHRHGGDLAAALDTVAASLLDRAEVIDEARALSSQARTSAAALVALPPFGAACFCLLDPSVAATLFTTVGGWCCLVVGVVLDGTGAWWMARMVDRALR